MFRGCFLDEDPEYWKEACKSFPNKVPRFLSKEEAVAFTRQHCDKGSNPDETHLRHSITTLTSWAQIETHLLPRLAKYSNGSLDGKSPVLPSDDMLDDNKFVRCSDGGGEGNNEGSMLPSGQSVYKYLLSRVQLPIHARTSHISTMNSLRYLFYHMRCGIFVMIRGGRPVIFCPFVNQHYRNNWKGALKIEGGVDAYYERKGTSDWENYLPDTDEWWANGNIICNVHKDKTESLSQWWGDHFNFQLLDMITETCNSRQVPDCEFYINKRDYPQLKYNGDKLKGPVEPYGFIFDEDDRDPNQDRRLAEEYSFPTYAPILSFYTSSRFADIPMPPSEDWEAATGEIFPPTFKLENDDNGVTIDPKPRDLFTAANLAKFERSWTDKRNTAFFRGTATGGGVTIETNQRLAVAQLSHDWRKQDGVLPAGEVPFLDAMITGKNNRDKKIAGRTMTHIDQSAFSFTMGKQNFTPIYEQSAYKYLLYIEGHCAACRYGFMMRLGSVILKVESKCVADQMWYFPLLQPYVDHVPVKADLSDLREQIQWCRDHDDECKKIAATASQLYDAYVSKEGILDYMQSVFVELARRHHWRAHWIAAAPPSRPPPLMPGHTPGQERQCCEELCDAGLCHACCALNEQRMAIDSEAAAQLALAEEQAATEAQGSTRSRMGANLKRMRERAKKKKEASAASEVKREQKRARQAMGARFEEGT